MRSISNVAVLRLSLLMSLMFFSFHADSSQAGECVTPPSDLRAWYPMDSAAGSTVEDLAGSNNGVRSGPVATTGKVAGAYDFDGSYDYVYVNDNSALNFGSGDFSVDAWIKTSDSDATIVAKRESLAGKYVGYWFMVNSGRLLLQIGDTTNGHFDYHNSLGPRVDDGQWHLVAVTVDRDNSTGGRMYIDGSLVYTFNPTNRSGDTSNSARLEIGRITPGHNYFNGAIDEVELFNRALDAGEVSDLWNAGANGKCKGGNPDPLTVSLQCFGIVGEDQYRRCTATALGGSGGNSFSWSYSGNGTMTPSGNTAIVDNCTGRRNVITVTVTDSAPSTAVASKSLFCGLS